MKATVKTTEANEMGWLIASKTFKEPFGRLKRRIGNVGGNKFLVFFKKVYLGD